MTGVALSGVAATLAGWGIGIFTAAVIAAVVLWSEAGWNRVCRWRERRRRG